MTKIFAIIAVGIPGSGKTTMLKPRAEKLGWAYICLDDIREKISGDVSNQSCTKTALRIFYQRIAEALMKGQNIIVDATHCKLADRIEMTSFCRRMGATDVHAHWFRAPLHVCSLRNRRRDRQVPIHILERMDSAVRLDPPALTDGFDQVIEVMT